MVRISKACPAQTRGLLQEFGHLGKQLTTSLWDILSETPFTYRSGQMAASPLLQPLEISLWVVEANVLLGHKHLPCFSNLQWGKNNLTPEMAPFLLCL